MDTIITGLIDQIQARVLAAIQAFVPTFSPIATWYVGLALLILALCFIGFFLPFKWVRAALGFIALLGAAFVAGGRTMRKEDQAEIDKAKAKPRLVPKKQVPADNQWNWFK